MKRSVTNKIITEIPFKRLFSLLFVFALFKSLAFFAPLGVQEVLGSDSLFGEFEYTFNLGQTLTGFFSVGLVGSYGYFVLKQKKNELKPIFHFHFVILTFILSSITLLFPSLLYNNYFGSIILGVAFADQILISGILKVEGRNNLSIIIDTGVYIVMGLMIVFALGEVINFNQRLWYLLVLFSLVSTTILYHLNHCKHIWSVNKRDLKQVYKFGGLILIAAPLIVLLTSSTRLYIEYYLDFSDVGIYSFYFRISSLILIIYRVFGILLFRKIFIDEHNKLDTYYSLIIIGLFLVNCLIFLIIPLILNGRYDKWDETYNEHSSLFILCLFQITFWINSALFEPIFQRENKMKQFILLILVVLIVMFSAFINLAYFNLLTLNNIVVINTLSIFLFFIGQQVILRKGGVIYRKTICAHVSLGSIYIFILTITSIN